MWKRLREYLRGFLHGRMLRLRRKLQGRLLRFVRRKLLRLLRRLFRKLLKLVFWRLQNVLHSDLRRCWVRRLMPRSLLFRLHDLVPNVLRLLRNELHKRIEVRR